MNNQNTTLDFYIGENLFANDLEVICENSKSIYAEGMYGDKYRLVKGTGDVYVNREHKGVAQRYNCF